MREQQKRSGQRVACVVATAWLAILPLLAGYDGDGIHDWADNGMHVPNPGQEDADGDSIGDTGPYVLFRAEDEPPGTFPAQIDAFVVPIAGGAPVNLTNLDAPDRVIAAGIGFFPGPA